MIRLVRQRKAVDDFLRTNGTISHGVYYRALFVACLNAFSFFLVAVFTIISVMFDINSPRSEGASFPFYTGWAQDHANWAPLQVSYFHVSTSGVHAAWNLSILYINEWLPVVLGLSVFSICGTKQEARIAYLMPFRLAMTAFGWQDPNQAQRQVSSMGFAPRSEPLGSTDAMERFVCLISVGLSTLSKKNAQFVQFLGPCTCQQHYRTASRRRGVSSK
jgi:hypothetical protein